jgi:hypothetical protein
MRKCIVRLCCTYLCIIHAAAKNKNPGTMISGQRETPISGPWDFVGPFGIGKTEIDADPIAAYGGIRNVSKGSKKRTFVSELADGGLVGWSRLKVSLDGAVTLQFPLKGDKARVNPSSNIQALQKITAQEMQGWLVAEFQVAHDGRYLLRCSPAHHVELDADHVLIHGDVYRRGLPTAVTLTQGQHTLYVRVRMKGFAQLSCSMRAASDTVEVRATLSPSPDIVGGYLAGSPPMLSLLVLNTATTWRQLSLRVSRSQLPGIAAKSWAKGRRTPRLVNAANASQWVAPGQALIMSAEVAFSSAEQELWQGADWAEGAPSDGDCLLAWIHVVEVGTRLDGKSEEAVVSQEIRTPTLRCRRPQVC